MITLSFKISLKGNKETVWDNYCQVDKWHAWDKHLETVSLERDFEKGTIGQMIVLGQPALSFQLIDVQKYQSFSNLATTPFGQVVFDHQIRELEAGKISIEHSVSLLTEEVEDVHMIFLKDVFEDVPQSVLTLKELIEG
ncbi:TPA: polyketide cyclase [Streptococcus suis]|nr:polyketide cyclase [Streptococcus suis]HEM4403126.1 polyketide cyclase [Streptococcus suis]HEM6045961.1 polyketide cyclase [Streptococcus suis]HEM6099109.1 polyketide cyclase [Streptococcus suis]HEM6173299.1 polyketide cyclase [Streptococcus suis]